MSHPHSCTLCCRRRSIAMSACWVDQATNALGLSSNTMATWSKTLCDFVQQHPIVAGIVATPVVVVSGYHLIAAIIYRQRPYFSFRVTQGVSTYSFQDPFFTDISDVPWISDVESQWMTIRSELDQFVANPPFPFAPYFRPDLVNRSGVWTTLGLKAWGIQSQKLLDQFPETMKVLDQIPGVIGISFNHLAADGEVKLHQGNSNGITRFHMGLKVPQDVSDCYFKVGTEKRKWEEGKLFGFCDAHWHTARNGSDQSRYILLFDVVKPELLHMQNYICARVVADLAMQYFIGRSKVIGFFHKYFRTVTRFVMYACFVPIFHVFVVIKPNILAFFE
eukprot:m.17876 g.17876  ORF g.17876 m.17876 type:complete len:334 (+) comp7605_c0_seq2:201-1202(+)